MISRILHQPQFYFHFEAAVFWSHRPEWNRMVDVTSVLRTTRGHELGWLRIFF
jgi:hypothetical protein